MDTTVDFSKYETYNFLVWQGIATATVTEKPEKREKTIPAKIGALMKKFPVQPE